MGIGKNWTRQEIKILEREYPNGAENAAKLIGRDISAIKAKAKKLQLNLSEEATRAARIGNLMKSCYPPYDD